MNLANVKSGILITECQVWLNKKPAITQDLLARAAELAEGFSLRAYDSVQLAAADKVFRLSPNALTFIGFDQKLNQATKLLGMQVSAYD